VEVNKAKMDLEIEKLREKNKSEQTRIDDLEKLYLEEKKKLQAEKKEIRNYFEMKKIHEVEEREKDRAMMFIQRQFEEWFEKVGKFKRKRKKKKKSN
jgi:2-oxoglutarate dehydrogenase complex dehydrogenase (E1) component-like enzyme